MKTKVLILDNIRSVENAGSIFRTADGLGVSKIYLVGTTPAPLDRFGRKRADFSKVALGAEETVEWQYSENIGSIIDELKNQGFEIICLEQTADSENLEGLKASNKFALILGNEVDGVSPIALEKADKIVEIPMKGQKESLNVAVAAGIALFVLS